MVVVNDGAGASEAFAYDCQYPCRMVRRRNFAELCVHRIDAPIRCLLLFARPLLRSCVHNRDNNLFKRMGFECGIHQTPKSCIPHKYTYNRS